jgi:hypothetical protein
MRPPRPSAKINSGVMADSCRRFLGLAATRQRATANDSLQPPRAVSDKIGGALG